MVLMAKVCCRSLLLQRVCNKRQDLLIFVEQQTSSEMAQSLVGKSWRGQQLQAFDLTKMCSLTEGEEV